MHSGRVWAGNNASGSGPTVGCMPAANGVLGEMPTPRHSDHRCLKTVPGYAVETLTVSVAPYCFVKELLTL